MRGIVGLKRNGVCRHMGTLENGRGFITTGTIRTDDVMEEPKVCSRCGCIMDVSVISKDKLISAFETVESWANSNSIGLDVPNMSSINEYLDVIDMMRAITYASSKHKTQSIDLDVEKAFYTIGSAGQQIMMFGVDRKFTGTNSWQGAKEQLISIYERLIGAFGRINKNR